MHLFRNRTIAGRLYLVGGLALAALAALAGVAVYFAERTRTGAEVLFREGLVGTVEAGDIELLLEKHRRVIEAVPLEFDRRQIARDKALAEEVAQRIEDLVARSSAHLADSVGEALPELWALGREILRLAENFAQAPALGVVEQYAARAERLQERIREHRRLMVARANEEARTLAGSARTLVNGATAIALAASLLIGPFSLMLLRTTVRRLTQITMAMRQLARDDTGVVLEAGGRDDEISEMAEAVAVFKANAIKLLEQQKELSQLNRWLDIALNNMARGLSMYDADQRLILCNAAYQRIYGLPDELTEPGVSFERVLEKRQRIVARIETAEGGLSSNVAEGLHRFAELREDGSLRQHLTDGRTIDISAKPLPWGGWVALHEDVSERVAAAEKITRLARQDTLTGLANRHSFRESLDAATAGLAAGAHFALIAIDLDKFKEVNDTLGHPAGDALLGAVGRRLTDLVRRNDVVARLGGDEFAIIQDGAASRSDAEALAERVIEALHQPFQILGHRVEIGGTAGIALAPENGEDAAEILRNADIALYRAKGEKRGTWRFFDPAMEGRMRARRALEADLGLALQNGELELHYQPIVSLAERRVTGCEALIRWRSRARGLVSPGDFIPIAEESGQIVGIGAWALREACAAAARWPGDLKVAVNLSVAQFSGPDLADVAAQALERSGLAPRRLELEVTESLLLSDDPATLELMIRLRALGLGIALDDFGTGYSSLSHLRSFPFDKLKIDQTFVRDLPQRRNSEAIVAAVAKLAVSLGMTTVAEGVETKEHLERVQQAGCDAVQGYLFSRPLPEAALAEAIADINRRLEAGALAA